MYYKWDDNHATGHYVNVLDIVIKYMKMCGYEEDEIVMMFIEEITKAHHRDSKVSIALKTILYV